MKEKDGKEPPADKSRSKQSSKKLISLRWVILVTILSFFVAGSLNFVSTSVLEKTSGVVPFFVLLFFVLLGIVFDMIGVASTTATEKEFHSMAAKRVRGAAQAVYLVRHADRVSNFCNDVVGDISGIVSGATGAVILARLAVGGGWREMVATFIMAGLTSALTIGGKAMGKSVAMAQCHRIIFTAGRIMAAFSFSKGKKG